MEERTTECRLHSVVKQVAGNTQRRLQSNPLLSQAVLFVPEVSKNAFNSRTQLRDLQLWLILKINNPNQLGLINCEIHFTSELEFTSGHIGQQP